MSQLELLAIGHSHLGAVEQAYKNAHKDTPPAERNARFFRLNQKRFQPNSSVENGRVYLTDSLKRQLSFIIEKSDPKAILLCAMGNDYNSMAMLRHPIPFNFYWPEMDFDDSGMNGAVEIPFDVMKAQMRDSAEQEALMFWQAIREKAHSPIYLLLPPPPIRAAAHIKEYPGGFAQTVEKYGVSPAGFRLKMHTLYVTVMREATAGSGVSIIEAPYRTRDKGFLARPYWSQDPTHANPRYGAIILEELRKLTGLEL